ncbi:MAG: hypothetical protein ACI4CS_10320, partial [Candidatus Weimeria sp.]
MKHTEMKKSSKKLALLTAFIMALSVFAAVPPAEAFAGSTDKETFYYFENSEILNSYTISIGATITSVSSSKSSVVKCSKDSSSKYRADLQMMKPGSSTVTISYKNYNGKTAAKKYSITVKNGSSVCSFGTPAPIP